jgi:type IV secretion system protein VirB1
MPLTWLAVSTMAAACAPTAAPSTLAAVASVESGLDPLAIGVNGARRQQVHPGSLDEAVATAHRLLATGRNIDLGLAQINSANLARLGLSVERAFDPCANLEASGRVLQAAYAITSGRADGPGIAVLQALSIYNTGSAWRGFANGYVAKVSAAAARIVPALQPDARKISVLLRSAPPAWDVFAQIPAPAAGFVFASTNSGDGH